MNANRTLLLLLAAVLAGLLWLFLGGEDPPGPIDSPPPSAPGRSVAGTQASARLEGASGGTSLELPAGSMRSELTAMGSGVRLAGEGRLTGQVVAREGGSGVGGVRVDLYSFPPQGADFVGRMLRLAKTGADFEARAKPVATTESEADGSFSFEGVRQGEFFAEARGGFAIPDPIQKVLVAPSGEGGPVTLHVRLGGQLTGLVRDQAGRPVAGARVISGQGEGVFLDSLRSGDVVVREARTDGKGRFELDGLPPGNGFRVTALHPGHGLAFERGVEVVAGTSRTVDLSFGPAGEVVGTVVSTSADEAGDELRLPVAGARISVVPRGLRELVYAEELLDFAGGASDAEGRFRLAPVPPGTFDLIAWAPGHRPMHHGPVHVAGSGVTDGGTLQLERGPMIAGRVQDTAGEPLSGVAVRWDLADFRGSADFTFAPILYQALEGFEFPVTDAEGRFVAGPFEDDSRQRLQFFKVAHSPKTERWKPSQGELVVTLSGGGAVEGVVVDRLTKRPVTSFTISGTDRLEEAAGTPGAWNPFAGGQLVEDEAGRFRVDAVAPGKAKLFVSAPGYRTASVPNLEVVEGELLEGVVVELLRGHVVRGRVVDGDAEPVVGARVAATRGSDGIASMEKRMQGGRREQPDRIAMEDFQNRMPAGALAFGVSLGLVESALTDETGAFELEGLAAGSWTVHATHRDFASGKSEVVQLEGDPEAVVDAELEVPASAEVVVEMQNGSRLFGRVSDRYDRPVAGTMVIAFSPAVFASGKTAGGGYQAETNAEGRYEMAHMVPGGYFLLVTRGNESLDLLSFLGTMQFELVTVPEGRDLEKDLIDSSAAATRVTGVVREAGEPVSGGTLIAMALDAANMLGVDVKVASVSGEGRYEFPGLAEGGYQFRYESRGRRAAMEVDVPDRPELRLDLDLPSGVIEGTVTDAATGQPVPRAFLTLRNLDKSYKLGGLIGGMVGDSLSTSYERADKAGAYSFDGLAPGSYELVAAGTKSGKAGVDFGPAEPVVVDVRAGSGPVVVDLALPPTRAIRGSVLDELGSPVPYAMVVARRDGTAELPREGKADAEGRFEVQGLGLGSYLVTVRAKGFATQAGLEVEVADDGAELDVVLHRGTPVEVLVLAADGSPAPGAIANLTHVAGEDPGGERANQALETWFSGKGVAGLNGVVDLGRFAPGTYELQVRRGGVSATIEGIEVPEGGELRIEAQLP
ncbi:MAG: carboxypeptidase-like regulatory domain-containing protein [Planctomycetota bacterium]|nr:carboxypeptidase-like regulatory domain-containing protein [Planctomycetota bacterium]